MKPSTAARLKGLAASHFGHTRSFDAAQGGYAAIPWDFRTVLATIPPRQWMLLTYLYLRVGPDGLTWLSDAEIGTDLGIGPKKLSPHFKALEARGFIATKRLGQRRYVKVVDPTPTLRRLVSNPQNELPHHLTRRLAEDLKQIDAVRKRRGAEMDDGKA